MMNICPLFSGSSGNAILVEAGETKVLVDAGKSGKLLLGELELAGVSPKELSAILVTHEHVDHIRGVGIMARRYDLPIYATKGTWEAMEESLGALRADQRIEIETGHPFNVGGLEVRAADIPHDAAEPVCYSLIKDGQKVTLATDMGHVDEAMLHHLMESELILLEANHDIEMLQNGRYPYPLKQRILGDYGHLSNDRAGELALHLAKHGTKHIILGHLSEENNRPKLAFDTVYRALAKGGIVPGLEVSLDVAKRSGISRKVAVGE